MKHSVSPRFANERGGALSYALLVFLMLSIAVAVVVGLLTFSGTNERKDALERQASTLAVGGMETFLAYLREYQPSMDVSPTAYVNRFANGPSQAFKWGAGSTDGWSFETPEGQRVRLNFTQETGTKDANGLYKMTIACRAVVDGNATSEIKYVFSTMDTVPKPGGGPGGGGTAPLMTEVSIDPDNRNCVPDTPNQIYIQGNPGQDNISAPGVKQLLVTPPSAGDTPISTAVDLALAAYKAQIESSISSLYDDVIKASFDAHAQPVTFESCTACSSSKSESTNLSEINKLITQSANNPVVIKIPSLTFNSGQNITWGTASKRVIVISDGLTFHSNSNLTIHGDLHSNAITFNNGGHLSVSGYYYQKASPAFHNSVKVTAGSVWIDNNLTVNADLTVAEDIYVKGNFTSNNNIALSFRHMYVEGTFTTNNNVKINASGTVFSRGMFTLHNTSEVNMQHLISYSSITFNNSGTFDVDGMMYGGPGPWSPDAITIHANSPLRVGSMISNGNLTINNGADLDVTGGIIDDNKINGDLLARNITLNGTNDIDIPNGDMIVQNRLTVNNHMDIEAGGNIVVGQNVTMHGTIKIDTGGESTSFLQKGVANPCAAPEVPPFSFDPKRSD